MTDGVTKYTRFCLIGFDTAVDEHTGVPLDRKVVFSMWFAAFGSLGQQIVKYARKRDCLVVDARLSCDDWTDTDVGRVSNSSWVVTGFRFGTPPTAEARANAPVAPLPMGQVVEGAVEMVG